MENLSNIRVFARLRFLLIAVGILFSAHALSASSYLDPARIDYSRPPAAEQLELIDCFKNGNCVQDNKIRIYPMPCSGSGNEDCTGCYVMRGSTPVRIGDLNLTTGTCSGVGSDSEQKIRVFVGYERKCPSGTAVGDPCMGNGELLLSCSMTTEGTAGGGDGGIIYDKECFFGAPYSRRARAALATITVVPSSIPTSPPVCEPGTMGTYPSCVTCSDTSFKSNAANGACTECSPPNIVNSQTSSVSTAGTTKTSASDCIVSFTCNPPYVQNLVNDSCDAPLSPSLPPPSPTAPNPAPSSAPGCSDAVFAITSSEVSPSFPPDYKVAVMLSLNRTFGPTDFTSIVATRNGQVSSNVLVTAIGSGSLSRRMSSFFLPAGDYLIYIDSTISGVACPRTAPYSLSVY